MSSECRIRVSPLVDIPVFKFLRYSYAPRGTMGSGYRKPGGEGSGYFECLVTVPAWYSSCGPDVKVNIEVGSAGELETPPDRVTSCSTSDISNGA